jgi:hypothetical protein
MDCSRKKMKSQAALFFAVLFAIYSFPVMAIQAPQVECFSGAGKALNKIKEVRVALSHSSEQSSFVVFYDGKQKASADIYCAQGFVGRCALHDDAGSLEIVSVGKEKVVLQFLGEPRIAKTEQDLTPQVGGPSSWNSRPLSLPTVPTENTRLSQIGNGFDCPFYSLANIQSPPGPCR